MTSIDPSLYLKSQQQTRTVSSGSNSMLGKDDFLKILMTQLQNQDPTSPMKDKEFISQMTSFSTLEQMTNMSTAIEKLTQTQNQMHSPLIKYSSMIGKEVTYNELDEDNAISGEQKTSRVHAVSSKNGEVILELDNGEKVMINQINKVADSQDRSVTKE